LSIKPSTCALLWVAFVWLFLAIAPLFLLRSTDPGLIKWPALALALTMAIFTFSRPKVFTWIDAVFGCYFIYSLARSNAYHDQWTVDLATWISLLSYILFRWKNAQIPIWLALAFSWVIGLRGILDILWGSIWSMGKPFQMVSFFVNRNMFAYLLTPLIWFSWATYKHQIKKSLRIIWCVTFIFLIVVLISNQSRGAFIGFLASMCVMGISKSIKHKSIFPLFKSALGVLASIAGSFILILSMQENLRELTNGIHAKQTAIYGNYHRKSSSEIRSWIWDATIRSWQTSPILGNGTGSTQYRLIAFQKPWLDDERNPYTSAWHAHSHYLEILNDKGIIGFAVELFLLLLALWGWAKSQGRLQFGFAALFGLSIHNIVAEAAEYPASIALYWGLIGFGIRLYIDRSHDEKKYFEIIDNSILQLSVRKIIPLFAFAYSLLSIRPIAADIFTSRALTVSDSEKIHSYASALNWWPDNPEALMALAVNMAENSRYHDAFSTLNHLDSVAPGLKCTSILRSQIYFHSGEMFESEKQAKLTLKSYPYYEPAQDVLLSALKQQRKCVEMRYFQSKYKTYSALMFIPLFIQDSTSNAKNKQMHKLDLPLPIWATREIRNKYTETYAFNANQIRKKLTKRMDELDRLTCD